MEQHNVCAPFLYYSFFIIHYFFSREAISLHGYFIIPHIFSKDNIIF